MIFNENGLKVRWYGDALDSGAWLRCGNWIFKVTFWEANLKCKSLQQKVSICNKMSSRYGYLSVINFD